jgi:hypothetical protein
MNAALNFILNLVFYKFLLSIYNILIIMYISKIDDIIDKSLDKFMIIWIIESKKDNNIITLEKLIKDPNFVKSQKEINKLIEFTNNLIIDKDLEGIVTKKSNIFLIRNTIIKYIAYYIFISIGINYNSKIDMFNNNIIEFTRNQLNLKLNNIELTDFFNSESNSNIIKITNIILELKDYLIKIKNSKNKDNQITLLNNYSTNFKEFINLYKQENIEKLLELFNSKIENKNTIINHNLIKIMIYLYLYKSEEKKELFNIIETTETNNGEFIFIDVVVPRNMYIDYDVIESILSPEDNKTNLPETIYNICNENYSDTLSNIGKYYNEFDIKIQKLFDTHIIIPIVDDFLLYHKDNEKYEKKGDNAQVNFKKRDETKIKYIINKLNIVTELYSNENEIKKLMNVPLIDRNVVLINTYEDVKILSKLNNLVKINDENLELITDLQNYMLYPYISFKDFKKNGTIFSSNKTLNAIRYCSFNNINKKKFDVIQTRIISENMFCNVVGLAIVSKESELDCINLNSFIDITKETKEPLNAIKTLLEQKIKSNILSPEYNTTINNNYFWLFDLSTQKINIPNYNISSSMRKNDIVKIIIAYLYDYLIETIIESIKKNVNISHPKDINDYVDMFDKYQRLYPDINNLQYANDVNELEYLMYYVKSIKVTETYDNSEDIFNGLYGNIYKLPDASRKKKSKIQLIKLYPDFKNNSNKYQENLILGLGMPDIRDIDEDVEQTKKTEYINSTCQHFISYDKIADIKLQRQSSYSTIIYEFIQQYVDVTIENNYICKSCKCPIDIKKFIIDGYYDNKEQMYKTFSMEMNLNIENLPEYEKYRTSIQNMLKIIEKLSSIFNIQGLNGISFVNNKKRRLFVKDAIDLILIHNKNLKKKYLSNRNNTIDKYGVNKNFSNLFIFELENTIFIYSSKDTDFYKNLKYNNVLTYILILLVLEINDQNILILNNDKICNYEIFKKINSMLFKGLNIIVNKSGDLKPILDYPVLCYILYITSCFITKYNIWADTLSVDNVMDKKKFNPTIQKSIINTFVELLNTILIIDVEEMKSERIYLYEIFQNKYYFKQNLFKDPEIINRLNKYFIEKNSNKNNIININSSSTKFDIIPTLNIFNKDIIFNINKHVTAKYFSKLIVNNFKINKISNLTNCMDGQFHTYKQINNKICCSNCNIEINTHNLIKDSEKLLYDRNIILYIRSLTKKYCIDGNIHKFEYDSKNDVTICKKCNYVKDSNKIYADNELLKMYNIIENNNKNRNLYIENILNNIKIKNKNKITELKKIFDKMMYKFQKYENNIEKSINYLLDNIQKLLGTDIFVNNKIYNLYYNIYIIDHDYNGVKLDSPIEIYEDNKNKDKFKIVESHPYFKRNVIVYTMNKNTKYELFYDMHEKILIGYREINKQYNNITNTICKLQINYSLKNMLLQFGLPRQQINITDIYPEIYGLSSDQFDMQYKKSENFNINDFIDKIYARRFSIIKNLGIKLNIYINRFKFNYNVTLLHSEYYKNSEPDEIMNNPLDILYNKYKKKINKNIITDKIDKNVSHVFLKYINLIINYLPMAHNNKHKLSFTNFIDYSFIIKNDFTSNLVFNYIIDEIIRLIEFNNNKTIKTNIINFIVDTIIISFNSHNYEISKFNKSINYFNQILYTSEFYLEVYNNNNMIMNTIDNNVDYDNLDEEKQKQILEDKEDDREEAEALDIDEPIDEEGLYDEIEDRVLEFEGNIQMPQITNL